VNKRLPFKMLDDPPEFAPLETWEQHLAEVQAMPNFQGKDQHIDSAKTDDRADQEILDACC